jgi:hypothetical protein
LLRSIYSPFSRPLAPPRPSFCSPQPELVQSTIIKLIRYVLLLPPFLLGRPSLPPHGATSLATPLSSTRLAAQTTRLRLKQLNKPEVEGPPDLRSEGPVGAYCGTDA